MLPVMAVEREKQKKSTRLGFSLPRTTPSGRRWFRDLAKAGKQGGRDGPSSDAVREFNSFLMWIPSLLLFSLGLFLVQPLGAQLCTTLEYNYAPLGAQWNIIMHHLVVIDKLLSTGVAEVTLVYQGASSWRS